MVNALRELGVENLAAGTPELDPGGHLPDKALMQPGPPGSSRTPSSAGSSRSCTRSMPDLIVAGGKTKYLALKTKTRSWDIKPRPLPPLCRLRGDGDLCEAAGPDGQQPHLAGPERQGAVGEDRRGSAASVPLPPAMPWRTCRRPEGVAGQGSHKECHGEPPEELAGPRRNASHTSSSTRCWPSSTGPMGAPPSFGYQLLPPFQGAQRPELHRP